MTVADHVAGRLAEHLARLGTRAEVLAVELLAGGACQDLFRVELARDGHSEIWVLRSDASTALPGSIPRALEFPVVVAAHKAGVCTPAARWFGEDIVRQGAGAYLIRWCEGIALGGKVTRAPQLQAARQALPEQLAATLARIHTVSPPPGIPGSEGDVSAARFAVDTLRASVGQLPMARPDLALILRWLENNLPDDDRIGLVHGDFRVGNFMVDGTGLVAVLDWEFAHRGSPFEDIGWLCVRDWRFGVPGQPVGGLCDRERFFRAYEDAGGVAVDRASVHFWEVFGNASWAVGALWQTQRFLDGELDFELLAIGRRASEMTWEALRLIKKGVPS